MSFGKLTAVVLVGHALGAATFVGLAGLALGLPARGLLLPYAMLFNCGLVLSPFLYWARLAREHPKSCAIRFAIAMFLYTQVIMVALGISTIRLGILSQTEVLTDYAPVMVPLTALTAIVIYVATRQTLKTP